eukprot:scaffold29097_cov31-Tisochrysis_lutea.AAC.3
MDSAMRKLRTRGTPRPITLVILHAVTVGARLGCEQWRTSEDGQRLHVVPTKTRHAVENGIHGDAQRKRCVLNRTRRSPMTVRE